MGGAINAKMGIMYKMLSKFLRLKVVISGE